jgi:hypothetical protein
VGADVLDANAELLGEIALEDLLELETAVVRADGYDAVAVERRARGSDTVERPARRLQDLPDDPLNPLLVDGRLVYGVSPRTSSLTRCGRW